MMVTSENSLLDCRVAGQPKEILISLNPFRLEFSVVRICVLCYDGAHLPILFGGTAELWAASIVLL
jgi:hypothetical protein